MYAIRSYYDTLGVLDTLSKNSEMGGITRRKRDAWWNTIEFCKELLEIFCKLLHRRFSITQSDRKIPSNLE